MMSLCRNALLVAALAMAVFVAAPAAHAQDEALRESVNALGEASLSEMRALVEELAGSGDPAAARVLSALGAGDLARADGEVFIARRRGGDYRLLDPLTGEEAGLAPSGAVERIRVSNAIRVATRAAVGALTLMSEDVDQRRRAARRAFDARDPDQIEALDEAIAAETDPGVALLLRQARAAAVLASDAEDAEKIEAVDEVAARGGRGALAVLAGLSDASPELAEAASAARARVERRVAMADIGENVFYGLSLGSVLLLAAVGLAVTFGVMGVINMAHGEMVMLGAYTTYVVQELIRAHAPGLFDASLFLAVPAAFLVAGAVGMAIERGVIRWLYGRPLETLLATWGVSLILQQGVRSLFGASNREVGIPSWMSGTVEIAGMALTLNRLTIIVFSLLVLAGLMLVLRATRFGLSVRAVTQNRAMAASMGIRTSWVDAMTFALGSGIAGVAGVALSQIDNVSPNLGQNYIIDSFMVVVFGGVGSLWGTMVAAFSLGVANKFLEPYAGAVLAKIVILVLIILFIQKRPRGLFALKGRAVEA